MQLRDNHSCHKVRDQRKKKNQTRIHFFHCSFYTQTRKRGRCLPRLHRTQAAWSQERLNRIERIASRLMASIKMSSSHASIICV